MVFNSLNFVFFFIIVLLVFWQLKNQLRIQNFFLLFVSAIFYGWWDYRFVLLLFIAGVIDFYFGQKIYYTNDERKRNIYIWTSALMNLSLLCYYKYLNFFIDSFVLMMNDFGYSPNITTLNIMLPLGISYYTFESMSYSLDIYKRKFKPIDDIVEYMAFICFFPKLVAGPIERASHLIPQFYVKKEFNIENATNGLRLMLYGFFKKIVIADNLSLRVDPIFQNPSNYSGLEVFLGAIFFSIQLYADLSGYADIARGTAKLIGFELTANFKTPFFSTNIPETWRRWHISVTTWFRDYFFLPVVKLKIEHVAWKIFTTILLFVLIGLWHGAQWTFIFFGFIIGLYYIPTIVSKDIKPLKNILKFFNTNKYIRPLSIFFTYNLFALTGVFFRSETLSKAFSYYSSIFNPLFFKIDYFISDMLIGVLLFMAFEWFMQHKDHQFEISSWPKYLRRLSYVTLILLILLLGHFGEDPFYYFKF